MKAVTGMVFFSISFLSSRDNSLLSFRSALLTLWTKINFFVGLKRRTARTIDETQNQIFFTIKGSILPSPAGYVLV
ncbi:MAG: hypothetical protein JSV71_00425 [Nitrospiraceae bacterium]|nr:MAG: hypothetical protein JSV71_00425 [Nitrospiraceae bacterium]